MDGKEVMVAPEFYPELVENQAVTNEMTAIPLADLTAAGVGLEPVMTAIQSVFSGGEATSGLYKVTIPNGGHLAAFKDGSGYLGTVLKENGAVGGGQARLNPVAFDPTMLCMSITLMNIQRKLNSIQKAVAEIMAFLKLKQKTELQGNLLFLADVLDNYRYNWNNEQYKSNGHVKAMDIRQQSEQAILLARAQINTIIVDSKVGDRGLLHGDQDVQKMIDEINSCFDDYRLAVYLYSMASYVELLLLGNTDSDYLNNVTEKIEDYSSQYERLYTKACGKMAKVLRGSVDRVVVNSLANAGVSAGKVMSRIPLVNRTPINKGVKSVGKKLKTARKKKDSKLLNNFEKKRVNHTDVFVDNINKMGLLYNEPLVVMFDREKVYLPTSGIANEEEK